MIRPLPVSGAVLKTLVMLGMIAKLLHDNGRPEWNVVVENHITASYSQNIKNCDWVLTGVKILGILGRNHVPVENSRVNYVVRATVALLTVKQNPSGYHHDLSFHEDDEVTSHFYPTGQKRS